MERLIRVVSIFSLLYAYSEAVCWAVRGYGHCCHYGEITLLPGQSYENTTGPYCYQCICSGDGDSLRCCGISRIITSLPDTCEIIQEGCHQVAVNKNDISKPCDGPVAQVVG
uniref:Uncharacterized protein n=1 Tax=Magallana gigas TaxID=29159 RepID=A0A8W8HSU1_MAGGI